MTKKKSPLDSIGQLTLTGQDYSHLVPNHTDLTLFIEFKKKGLEREEISKVKAFEKKEGKLYVVNKYSDYRYIYEIKEVKKVFVVFEPNIEGEA